MSNALREMETVIEQRREEPMEGSYTCYLFERGLDKMLKKMGEECAETIIAAKNEDKGELVEEINDLLYHLLVLMNEAGISMDEVEGVCTQRAKKIGNLKTSHQSNHES